MERQTLLFRVFVHAAAAGLALLLLAPFLWLMIMSVSSTKDLTSIPLHWLPDRFDVSRYVQLLTLAEHSAGEAFVASLRNSLARNGRRIGARSTSPSRLGPEHSQRRSALLAKVFANYLR